MLPRKGFCITIGLGDDGNKDEELQLAFKALVYVVSFEQAIMRIFVKVNGKRFLLLLKLTLLAMHSQIPLPSRSDYRCGDRR